MPYLETNGLTFHYQEFGPKNKAEIKAPPLILLHGVVIGNVTSWYFSISKGLAKNRRVIMYDLRCHGLSDFVPNDYCLDSNVKDLLSILDALGIDEPIDLAGHSYGALISLYFGIRYPERLNRLALVEGPIPPFNQEHIDELTKLRSQEEGIKRAKQKKSMLPKNIVAILLKKGRQLKRLVAHTERLCHETDLIENMVKEQSPTYEELQRVNVPVLLLYGEKSTCPEAAERLSSELPQVQLRLLNGGGHYLLIEMTKQVTKELLNFFTLPDKTFDGHISSSK